MTHSEFDLSDLLDALRAGELTDPIRTSLQRVLQHLIELEATEAIGAARTNEPNRAPTSATVTGCGCCRPRPATSS